MCHYQSIRHAQCGHDMTHLLSPCHLGHSSNCHQRYDMGMRQDASLCRNCQRRVAQMYAHGEPLNPLASLSAEIKRKMGGMGHKRAGSAASIGSVRSVGSVASVDSIGSYSSFGSF